MTFTIFINDSQFYLIGTKLPIRRYGLLFVPMFMFCFCFLSAFLFRQKKLKIISLFLVYGLALACSFHTFSAFSANTYLDWIYEKETRNVMKIFEKDVLLTKPSYPVTLGITWLFEPTVNFYRQTDGLSWLNQVNRDGPSIKADYYCIFKDDLSKVPQQ